jgi:hypothetical protein
MKRYLNINFGPYWFNTNTNLSKADLCLLVSGRQAKIRNVYTEVLVFWACNGLCKSQLFNHHQNTQWGPVLCSGLLREGKTDPPVPAVPEFE